MGDELRFPESEERDSIDERLVSLIRESYTPPDAVAWPDLAADGNAADAVIVAGCAVADAAEDAVAAGSAAVAAISSGLAGRFRTRASITAITAEAATTQT